MPLMEEFLASRRQMAEDLAAAVAAGERETIRATAHKLAGSLAMYGFRDASRASRALEQAAGSEDLEALRRRCDSIGAMLAKAQPVARPVTA
jgi:HPt (histidine-containing phosphotransfer) domain-containing protein